MRREYVHALSPEVAGGRRQLGALRKGGYGRGHYHDEYGRPGNNPCGFDADSLRECNGLLARHGVPPDQQVGHALFMGGNGAAEDSAGRPLTDAAPLTARRLRQVVDVLLQSTAGDRWVLDAKYKRGYGREDREDRFQACAYAVAFDAARGSLAYPTATGETRSRLLLSGHVGERRVTVDSVQLPMVRGPGACRAGLLEVMQCPVAPAVVAHCGGAYRTLP